MIVKLELNSSDEMILCSGDTGATYRLSDISLEYGVIFDQSYATVLTQLSSTLIRYTNLTSTHYQTLSKKKNFPDTCQLFNTKFTATFS